MPRRSEAWWRERERGEFLFQLGYFIGRGCFGDTTLDEALALLNKIRADVPAHPETPE